MSHITEEIRAKSDELYYGDAIAQEKTKLLLREVGLPNGLLPLKDVIECGYVKETGFVWMKQKKAITHKFDKVGKLVTYAKEVTAYVEKNRVRNLTGVKAKEVLIWITLSDIYVDDPPTGKITFQIPAGMSRSYPVDAFEVEEVAKEKKELKGSSAVAVAVNVKEKEKEQENEKEKEKEKEKSELKEKKKNEEKEKNEVREVNGAPPPPAPTVAAAAVAVPVPVNVKEV